ncbi:MAG TPA: YMGG-like glycine zipper-containing protein [Phenylobacterium sp.]|nr:YMGG-like glycine zipper-containing protein [Phenylobacterium sp.]
MRKPLIALAGAGALLCACADDPHTTNTTLGGAAIGAVAGAVIGNNTGSGNAATGALIGGALGAAAGAVKGCHDQGGCGNSAGAHRQYYDERAGRYYYYDSATGRYFWEDGSPR